MLPGRGFSAQTQTQEGFRIVHARTQAGSLRYASTPGITCTIDMKDHRRLVRILERKRAERFAGLLRLRYQAAQVSFLLIREALSIPGQDGLDLCFGVGC